FPQSISFYNLIPQGMETLFALAYAVGGDSSAKLLHLTFLGATVLLMQWIASRFGDPHSGWCAGALYALTPVVGMSATCAFNDAAVTCCVLAAFAVVAEWWRNREDWLLMVAGVCAGFCYAIKFTGGIVAPVALLLIAVRARRIRPIGLFVAGVLAMSLPWVARAWILTGNPFAPLLNRFFPNPYFRIESEQALGRYLRSYGDVEWSSIGQELTLYGDLLQGVLGPVWLLAPLGLLALRKREGRLLLGAGAIAAIPWTLNVGVRFLMPALPFAALAWIHAMPRAARVALVILHAVLSWPAVLERYTPPDNWALIGEIPWRAALRLESKEQYLARRTDDSNIAEIVRTHTNAQDRILDLAGAPAAITPRVLFNAWQTAAGENMVKVLQTGAIPDRGLMVEWRSRFREIAVDAVRVEFQSSQVMSAGLHEIRLLRADGNALKPNALWTIEAEPNIWESPMALDRSLVTSWWTWEPVRVGMFYQVEMPARERIAQVRIVGHRSAASLVLSLQARSGTWKELPLDKPVARPGLNLRHEAIAYLRRNQITHLLVVGGTDGFGLLSQDLIDRRNDWQLRLIANHKGVALLKIAEPAP
ncbi:MAG: glycosyltransferase family 39 protein, partial [Bryobacterales bacterium]|nr:glycosyltransferase family 39 protein [Bryobacterales bacterium]